MLPSRLSNEEKVRVEGLLREMFLQYHNDYIADSLESPTIYEDVMFRTVYLNELATLLFALQQQEDIFDHAEGDLCSWGVVSNHFEGLYDAFKHNAEYRGEKDPCIDYIIKNFGIDGSNPVEEFNQIVLKLRSLNLVSFDL